MNSLPFILSLRIFEKAMLNVSNRNGSMNEKRKSKEIFLHRNNIRPRRIASNYLRELNALSPPNWDALPKQYVSLHKHIIEAFIEVQALAQVHAHTYTALYLFTRILEFWNLHRHDLQLSEIWVYSTAFVFALIILKYVSLTHWCLLMMFMHIPQNNKWGNAFKGPTWSK